MCICPIKHLHKYLIELFFLRLSFCHKHFRLELAQLISRWFTLLQIIFVTVFTNHKRVTNDMCYYYYYYYYYY
jgi:hypothetical protein